MRVVKNEKKSITIELPILMSDIIIEEGWFYDGKLEFTFEIERINNKIEEHTSIYPIGEQKKSNIAKINDMGSTCYVSAVIPALYYLSAFKDLIYRQANNNFDSVVHCLKEIFLLMEKHENGISTSNLMKAFGWTKSDLLIQHDIQEFLRLIIDRVESETKDTPTISWLFKGILTNSISFTELERTIQSNEEFYEINLVVKGYKDLNDSLKSYFASEALIGDNQYTSGINDRCNANKQVRIVDFPAVLQLHLNRFECVSESSQLRKINDYFEFPKVLELSSYLKEENISSHLYYDLYCVFVHSGDINAGHYYSFVKPELKDTWIKVKDGNITYASENEAITQNFGGNFEFNEVSTMTPEKNYSAYVLLYTRRENMESLFYKIEQKDYKIPKAMISRSKSEDFLEYSMIFESDLPNSYPNSLLYNQFDDNPQKIRVSIKKKVLDLYDDVSQMVHKSPRSIRLISVSAMSLMSIIHENESKINSVRNRWIIVQEKDENEPLVIEGSIFILCFIFCAGIKNCFWHLIT